MGNSETRSVYRKHDDWYYFEKLPPRLREALNTSAYEYDSKWFYDHWNKGKSVDWCIKMLREADLERGVKDIKWRAGFKWQTARSPLAVTKVKPLYR